MNRWYVMHSKPQKEVFLRERLRIQRMEVYLPLIRLKPVNPRARKVQPFFPGYLFLHMDLEEISSSELRGMPGSIGIVSYGGEPAYVGDALIHTIQKQVEEINDSINGYVDRFKSGDLVVINDGPFAAFDTIASPARKTESELKQVISRSEFEKNFGVAELWCCEAIIYPYQKYRSSRIYSSREGDDS